MPKTMPYSTQPTETAITQATGAGSTTNGALAVTIVNRGSAAGTVDGVSLPAGEGWVFENNGPYSPISYDATGTTFDIVEETE